MEGAPPYIPFVEIIESAARIVEPTALLSAMGESAPEVAKLTPELRHKFRDIPTPPQLPPDQERRRMFNGVLDFISQASRQQPLLLVIEDLHWTDEPTLLLLQHIVQQLHEMPVLMVGTYRDTELDVARSLASALKELLRQRLAHDLLLKPLPSTEVSAMLQGRSGYEPPARLVAAIYEETEGNPFFVEEIFKHLAEEGKLFDADGQWHTDLRIDELDVPRGVLLVIGHRLGRVTQECKRTLTTAAGIGRTFGFQLLEELTDLKDDAVFDAIDEAERAQLIRSATKGGEAHIMFAHEYIRQTLLSELSTPRHQRLHIRVAEAIERLYATAIKTHASDLAYHYFQGGGDTDKIIEYAVLAAERATAQTAFEETVVQYERAIQALQRRQPVDELRRCNLMLALGRAHGNAGDPSQAQEVFLKITEIARKIPAPEQFVDSVIGLASLLQVAGVLDLELLDLLEEGLAMIPEKDSAIRATLLGRLSTHLAIEGKQDRRIALSEQAVAMARRIGDPKALSQAVLSSILIWEHSLAQKISDCRELAELEEELGHPEGWYWGLTWLCHYCMEQGDVSGVEANLAKLKKLATEFSHPAAIWKVPLIEAMLALMRGRFEECEALTQEAFALGQKVSEETAAQYWGAVMYWLRWMQGRLAEMEDAWKGLVQQYPDATLYRGPYALILKVLGHEEEAREEMDRLATHDFADLPKYFLTLTELIFPSELAVAFGDRRRAALLYDLLHPYADRVFVLAHHAAAFGAVTQWLGMLATTMQRWDSAADHFEAALETNARIGARPFLARSQHEYTRMLVERGDLGDSEKAKALLIEATATYRELGMPTFLEDAEELKGKL
jgi:tetratricopeptide (TPR) repeat protein